MTFAVALGKEMHVSHYRHIMTLLVRTSIQLALAGEQAAGARSLSRC